MGARFRLRQGFDTSGFSPNARVVLLAMQRYGLIVADNGSDWYLQGTVDDGWTNGLLDQLKEVPAGAFVAVDAGDAACRRTAPSSRTDGLPRRRIDLVRSAERCGRIATRQRDQPGRRIGVLGRPSTGGARMPASTHPCSLWREPGVQFACDLVGDLMRDADRLSDIHPWIDASNSISREVLVRGELSARRVHRHVEARRSDGVDRRPFRGSPCTDRIVAQSVSSYRLPTCARVAPARRSGTQRVS